MLSIPKPFFLILSEHCCSKELVICRFVAKSHSFFTSIRNKEYGIWNNVVYKFKSTTGLCLKDSVSNITSCCSNIYIIPDELSPWFTVFPENL